MARATLSKIQALVYSFLNVDSGVFGTYASNARYPSALIDDEIYNSDNYVGMLLTKNGQDSLMSETVVEATKTTTGQTLPVSWVIVGVRNEDDNIPMVEVSFGEYEMMVQGSATFGTPSGYYCIKDNKLFFLNGASNAVVSYINFSKNTTLKSPDGFEEIIAFRAAEILAMKRADNPAASQFFGGKFKEYMAAYMTIPEVSDQDEVES